MTVSDMPKAAQLSFFGAAVLGLVAIGFFSFIFFWNPSSPEQVQSDPVQIEADKERVLRELNPAPPAGSEPLPSQADELDVNAAAKLRVLESLNAN